MHQFLALCFPGPQNRALTIFSIPWCGVVFAFCGQYSLFIVQGGHTLRMDSKSEISHVYWEIRTKVKTLKFGHCREHRCAIPARINQYQYLILKNQVSIPISISIFQISEIDTDFNTNTPDLENQYRYQYQYFSFDNSITIPIPILKILSFNINLDLNTKVLQYSEWKNFQLPAVNWKCHVAKLIQTKQFGVD